MGILNKTKPEVLSKIEVNIPKKLQLQFELACLNLGLNEAEIAIKLGTTVATAIEQMVTELEEQTIAD